MAAPPVSATRTVAGCHRPGDYRQRPDRIVGAVRQPQLRGPRAPAGQGQLAGLATAGGRLRPGRHHAHQHGPRAAGLRRPESAGVPEGYLAEQRRIAEAVASIDGEMFRSRYADVFSGDEHWQKIPVSAGDTYQWNASSATCRTRPTSKISASHQRRRRTSIMPGFWRCSATPSPPTTSRPPATSRRVRRPACTCSRWGGAGRLQLLRLAPRSHEVMMRGTFANIRIRTRCSAARKAATRSTSRVVKSCRSTTPPCAIRPKACRWW